MGEKIQRAIFRFELFSHRITQKTETPQDPSLVRVITQSITRLLAQQLSGVKGREGAIKREGETNRRKSRRRAQSEQNSAVICVFDHRAARLYNGFAVEAKWEAAWRPAAACTPVAGCGAIYERKTFVFCINSCWDIDPPSSPSQSRPVAHNKQLVLEN